MTRYGLCVSWKPQKVSKGPVKVGLNPRNGAMSAAAAYWGVAVQVGDLVVVDGGMVSLEVKQKMGPDVEVVVVDPGIVLSRANLTFRRNGGLVRARNSMLPVLSSKVRARIPLSHAQHSSVSI